MSNDHDEGGTAIDFFIRALEHIVDFLDELHARLVVKHHHLDDDCPAVRYLNHHDDRPRSGGESLSAGHPGGRGAELHRLMSANPVHIAAAPFYVRNDPDDEHSLWTFRQRCGWCGAAMIEVDELTDEALKAVRHVPSAHRARRDENGVWWVPVTGRLEDLEPTCVEVEAILASGGEATTAETT